MSPGPPEGDTGTASARVDTVPTAPVAPCPRHRSGRLFRKYILLFVLLVGGALLASGTVQLWFSYEENKAALARVQKEKALSAAARIEGFIDEITRQIGWTARAQWARSVLEQRRVEYLQLLRQASAVTEISHLDSKGHEELMVSRLAMDVIGSGIDYSRDPKFTEAKAHKTWFSPVYFRKESEPYITVAIAGAGRDTGVTVAEVNLKFIWDVVSRIKIGKAGYAYVADPRGLLIAHPDIGLVLRKTDLARLPQVKEALAAPPGRDDADAEIVGRDLAGKPVLTANAPVAPIGWRVFVDLPLSEAFAPLYESLIRTAALMLLGLTLAVAAGLLLARRMVVPIAALQRGAERIGAGDLGHRIEIRTGDELEALADQFNSMASQLEQSYAGLERTVAERTRALAQSIRELTALGEVSRAVSSTLDLKTVFDTVVSRSVELAGGDAGAIFRYNRADRTFSLGVSLGLDDAYVSKLGAVTIYEAETAMGRAIETGRPVQVPDLEALPGFPLRELSTAAGVRAALVVPLIGPNRIIGTLVVLRRAVGAFPDSAVDLMRTFANQAVLAIQNARLFREIEDKSRQLEIASQHKSQFLANMSHELRTPLNAVLGYAEMLADGIYGDLPEKSRDVLGRVMANGKHLLALINDVLDLAKIEAGQLTLSVGEYAMDTVVQSVVVATESLAREKGLALSSRIAPGMPTGFGDERRLTQVLLNLVGNAIKFTDSGSVTVTAEANDGKFHLAVRDTGPGIALADQSRIFDEFQQLDNTSTRKKGGTGLGLAISRRIVEMHHGTITVQSAPGQGATFSVDLPVRVADVREGA